MSTFAPPIRDQSQQPAKWFVSGDWDGYFGLFFAVSYVLAALFLLLSHFYIRHRGSEALR